MRKLCLLLSLCLPFLGQPAAFAQASPFNLNIFKTQSFTATGQTGTVIQLNGLTPGQSTVGSSYASGTLTVGGTTITTVSFQVWGSSDNGATFYLLPVFSVGSPTSPPVTTVTVTAAGLYQFSLAGLSHVKFVTTGTFTATSLSITLTGSPNASISRNSGGGVPSTGGAYTGPITAPQTNLDFYVAGTPATCSGGTTALDCAWIAANTYASANSTAPVVHLAPGVNSTCTGLSTSAPWRPAIMGNGMYGSVIQQSCSISSPTVSYGCGAGTSDANPTHIERVTIDANNLAPQALSFSAHNLSFIEHVVLRGANGANNYGQIGSNSCAGGTTGSTFQLDINDLYVDGKGTGPANWAVGTVSISSGIPSVTVTTPGLYNHQNPPGYLTGYGAGSNPCTAMGTVTVNTTASGSQFTVSSVTLSGFSGCVAGVGAYIYIPDLPLAQFGVDFQNNTDTMANMIVTNGVGQIASIRNANSANTFIAAHPYNAYVGIKEDGGGSWYGTDCDSNLIMFQFGAPTREHGCNVFYNKHPNTYPGATVFLLANGSNGSLIEGTNVVTGSLNTDYHEFVTTAGGPIDTGQGSWPVNSVDFGSPTASPNGLPARHMASPNQVDDFVGFTQFATSAANTQSFGRKWTYSAWNGTTHQESTWGMAPFISNTGVPSQDFMHLTAPSNEQAPVSGVGLLFDPVFTATVSNNYNSMLLAPRGSYHNGTAPTNLGWNHGVQIGTGTAPTNNYVYAPSACPSGTNCALVAPVLQSNVATGQAPVIVTSTTPVPNLALASDSQLPINVTAGSCTLCNVTYNAQGIGTAYSSGAASVVRTASGYCTGTATASATGLSVTNLGGNSFSCTGTSGSAGMLLIGSGTLSNLSVRCNTTGVSALSGVFTLSDLRAGTNTVTPLTVTYGTTAGGTMVQDTTHTYAYLSGDMLRLNFTTQAVETLANCDVSFNY